MLHSGFPGGTSGKEPTCPCRRRETCKFNSWVGQIPWRRAWQPTPVFLPGESHGQRSLVHRVAQSLTGLKRISTHTLILHSHVEATNKGVTGNCYLSATRRDEDNFCSKVTITSPTWESLLPITWHWPPILPSAALKFFSDKTWPHSHFLMSFSTFRVPGDK